MSCVLSSIDSFFFVYSWSRNSGMTIGVFIVTENYTGTLDDADSVCHVKGIAIRSQTNVGLFLAVRSARDSKLDFEEVDQ